MGDLGTHGTIGQHVMAILQKEGPKNEKGQSVENYMFFELGNFLTDMSQLRDPPAHINGKIRVWEEGRKEQWEWVLGLVNLDQYLDELMGRSGTHGELAEFLREFAYSLGCERFRKENPPIPAKEFDLIFDKIEYEKEYKGYTQYWPHEHLDFPPWPHGNVIGYRQQSKVDRHLCDGKSGGSKRKIFQYLEDQIEFCAELLTIVEFQWRALVEKGDTPQNREDRNKILALYGHVSHTVEDFFFHSNFIDNAWKQLKRPLTGNEDTRRCKRFYQRRLRGPKGSDPTNKQLSNIDSEMTDLVFTGSFGSEDIFFTVKDALKTFENKMNGKQWVGSMPSPVREVFAPFFNEEERRKVVKDKEKREQWLKNLRTFVNNADQLLAPLGSVFHDYSIRAIKKMCEIDKRLYDKYTWIPEQARGPFAFLLELLGKADDAVESSEKWSQNLDTNDNYTKTIQPTYNGATGENLGSHSLINKDNDRKKPLFQPALNAAICVASYIAEVIVGQIKLQNIPSAKFPKEDKTQKGYGAVNTVAFPQYVDWLHLLQHFLCHPDECENQWHVEAMKDKNALTYHVIQYVDWGTVNKRMQLAKRSHLQELYKTEATAGEEDWNKLRTSG